MSVKTTTRVWDSRRFTGNALVTLLYLADRSDNEGVSWPAVAKTAHDIGLQVRRTQYILRELEEAGEIYIHRPAHGPGRSHGCGIGDSVLIATGRTAAELKQQLQHHERLLLSEEEATSVVADIEWRRETYRMPRHESEKGALFSTVSDRERVHYSAPFNTDKRCTFEPEKGAVQSTEKGALSCVPYKEEPPVRTTITETPLETAEKIRGGENVPVAELREIPPLEEVASFCSESAYVFPAATTRPPGQIRKPRLPQFQSEAMPYLSAYLEATGKKTHYEMDVLGKSGEEAAAKIAMSWYLSNRDPADFARFVANWVPFLKARGMRESAPALTQWNDWADDVLRFSDSRPKAAEAKVTSDKLTLSERVNAGLTRRVQFVRRPMEAALGGAR